MLVLFSLLANAQTVQTADAETLYVVGDAPAQAKRYLDAEASSGGEVVVGASGQVLFREGGWVRLQVGERYVWLDEALTSKVAPARALPPQLGNIKLGEGLNLGEGLRLGAPSLGEALGK